MGGGSPNLAGSVTNFREGSGLTANRLEGLGGVSGSGEGAFAGRGLEESLGREALGVGVHMGRDLYPALDAVAGEQMESSTTGAAAGADGETGSLTPQTGGSALGFASPGGKSTRVEQPRGVAAHHTHAAQNVGTGQTGAGDSEAALRKREKRSSGRGNGAAGSSAGPLDSEQSSEPASGVMSADVTGLSTLTSGVNPRDEAESRERLPMMGHLRPDSVYRLLESVELEGGASTGGLVSATIGPVEPLSLAQLAARKAKTGPSSGESGSNVAGQAGGVGASVAKSVATTLQPTKFEYALEGAPWGELAAFDERIPERESSSDEFNPDLLGGGSGPSKADREGAGMWPSQGESRAGSKAGLQEVQDVKLSVWSAGQKRDHFSLQDAPWVGLESSGGFASTNPFAGPAQTNSEEGSKTARRSAGAIQGADSRSSSLDNPKGVLTDLYPPLSDGLHGCEEQKIGGEAASHKRRVRSLSGSGSSALGESYISPVYSPVKYPPPRPTNLPPGTDGARGPAGAHRRSLSAKDTSNSIGEHFGKDEDARVVVEADSNQHVGSDNLFEQQLAAAIAMSLEETEADEERRRQNEAFEREAFAVAL